MTAAWTDPDLPSVVVQVSATSANLGPGFDALGLALGVTDQVELIPGGDGVRVHMTGVGVTDLPADGRHLIARSVLVAASRFGLVLNGFELRCVNSIPQGQGMGSSAAAIVAGVSAAWLLAHPERELDRPAVLALAAELEGHPDNVAACVHGGLTISWSDYGVARSAVSQVHPDVILTICRTGAALSTETARGLLPDEVPHRDAALTAGRAALLVHALTREPALLMPATEDRLHQSYRAAAMPDSAALLGDLRAAGVPAVISGAGPSVLAFARLETVRACPTSAGWQSAEVPVGHGVRAVRGSR